MNYLGIYDDSKRAIAEKIALGKQAYIDRFGYPPAFVLLNEVDKISVEGMGVIVKPFIRRNNFWFGQSDC